RVMESVTRFIVGDIALFDTRTTATAASGITRQPRRHPQFHQRGSATAWGLPLPPQSSPKSQPDPAGKVDQHFGRFAEAEIAAPAPHIGCQAPRVWSGPSREARLPA